MGRKQRRTNRVTRDVDYTDDYGNDNEYNNKPNPKLKKNLVMRINNKGQRRSSSRNHKKRKITNYEDDLPNPKKICREENAPVTVDTITYSGDSPFWKNIDHYFQNITEDDLRLLELRELNSDDDILSVPPLGRSEVVKRMNQDIGEKFRYYETSDQINDILKRKDLVDWRITKKSLSQRMYTSFVETKKNGEAIGVETFPTASGRRNEDSANQSDGESSSSDERQKLQNFSPFNNISVERRIQLELKHCGLLDSDFLEISDTEDDEICSTIRSLQKRLIEQVAENNIRKEALCKVVKSSVPIQRINECLLQINERIVRLAKVAEKDRKQKYMADLQKLHELREKKFQELQAIVMQGNGTVEGQRLYSK